MTKTCFYVIIWIVFLQIINQRWEGTKLKNKIFDISLSVCGAFFALIGFIIISTNFWAGFFMLLTGVALIPSVYERSKAFFKEYSGKIPKKYYIKMSTFWNKSSKFVKIALPLVFLALSVVFIPKNNVEPASSEASEPVSSTVQDAALEEPTEEDKEDEKSEVTDLHFDETELQLDVNGSKNLVLKVSPENAGTEDLEYCTSNEEVASLEKADENSEGNSINLKLTPVAEGECEVFAKTSKEIESNKVSVKVVDNERILAEEKAKQEEEKEEKSRQEAEIKAKEEAEKQAAKAAEEQQIKVQAEEKKQQAVEKTKKVSSSSSTSKKGTKSSSSAKSNKSTNNSNGKQIYRTPKGKRYHFDPDCGGKNSYSTTLDEALSAGLTPCKKCVRQ